MKKQTNSLAKATQSFYSINFKAYLLNFIWMILILVPLGAKVIGQDCYPCIHTGLSAEYTGASMLVPLCAAPSWSVTVFNENGTKCPSEVQLSITFINTNSVQQTLQQNEAHMSCLKYSGNLNVASDIVVPGGNEVRRTITFDPVVINSLVPQVINLPFEYRPIVGTPLDAMGVEIRSFVLNGSNVASECTKVKNPGPINFGTIPFRPVTGVTTLSQMAADGLISPVGFTEALVMIPTANGPSALTWDIPDFDFGIGSGDLLMSPGATLIVPSGNTLNINGIFMRTCPNAPIAQGVVVESGATLNVVQSNLTDARFAIDAKPGSILNINKTTFTDNYVGLNLDMSNALPGGEKVILKSFSNNTFSTSQGLKPAFNGMPETTEKRGFCGIQLKNYMDFNVVQKNTFLALANGIVAENSVLNIGDMSFEDMNSGDITTPYPFEGRAVSMVSRSNQHWGNLNAFFGSMNMVNCKTGVFASGMAGTVTNCTMKDVVTGVDWKRSPGRDIAIYSNVIEAGKQGIRSFMNEPVHPISSIEGNKITISNASNLFNAVSGIRMDEGQLSNGFDGGWKVLNNEVTMKNGGKGIAYTNGTGGNLSGNTVSNESGQNNYQGMNISNGILTRVEFNTINQTASGSTLGSSEGILSASGSLNRFSCNCLDNTNVGMQFYDMGDFKNRVRGNHFNKHSVGLQLGSQGNGNVVIGVQTHTGNLWDLNAIDANPGSTGGINWNIDNLTQSRFFVDPSYPPFYPPVEPGTDWFFPQGDGGQSFNCELDCKFPTAPPVMTNEDAVATELDEAILNGTLTDNKEWGWKGRYRLYRRLLRQPSLAAIPEYAAFMMEYQDKSEGQLASIAIQKSALLELTPTQKSQVDAWVTERKTATEAIAKMDDKRIKGEVIDETEYNTWVNSIIQQRANAEQFWNTINAERVNQLHVLQDENEQIATELSSDANQKAVNSVFFALLLGDAEAEKSAEKLDVIASQCAVEGGDAVYEARALAGHYLDKVYSDDKPCAEQGERSNLSAKKWTSAQMLYPNPTTGVVSWNGGDGGAYRVRVFNQLGQLVLEDKIQGNRIDLSGLGNGHYQMEIFDTVSLLIENHAVVVAK